MMISNNVESMNAIDKKARNYHINSLIELLRIRMQQLLYERRELDVATHRSLAKDSKKRLIEIYSNSVGTSHYL